MLRNLVSCALFVVFFASCSKSPTNEIANLNIKVTAASREGQIKQEAVSIADPAIIRSVVECLDGFDDSTTSQKVAGGWLATVVIQVHNSDNSTRELRTNLSFWNEKGGADQSVNSRLGPLLADLFEKQNADSDIVNSLRNPEKH